MDAVVSRGGADTQQAVPGSAHQQSVNNVMLAEEISPVDIINPTSQRRPEVSCTVYMCPQTHFINIKGADCLNDVHLPVPIK